MMEDELGILCDALDNLSTRRDVMLPDDPEEEGTKLALIQPFFMSLGYELADPSVCRPEYKAGWATKSEEKVDYALLDEDGGPMILVECKRLRERLDLKHASQLAHYFANTDATVGILTNGGSYEIYLDTVKPNVMDKEPIFKFDLSDQDVLARRALARLARRKDGSFDLDGFREHVDAWRFTTKYKPEVMRIFEGWLTRPDQDFVRLLEKRVNVPANESFQELVGEWFAEFVTNKKARIESKDTKPKNEIATGSLGWALRPLPGWNPSTGDSLPREIVFPDNDRSDIKAGYDILVQTVGWLHEKNLLTRLPVRRDRAKRYLVAESPVHSNGEPMTLPRKISGVFVEGHASIPQNAKNARFVIQYAGQDPAEFRLLLPEHSGEG